MGTAEKQPQNKAGVTGPVAAWKVVAWMGGAVLAISLLRLLPSRRVDPQIEARTMAKEAVRTSLKAPSTAKFGWYDETSATDLGDGIWSVAGWVEAQNSFGVLIRNHYLVHLRNTDGKWALEKVTLTPR